MKRQLFGFNIRRYFLLSIIFTMILCSGCTHDMSKQEINAIDLVLLLGIDYSEGEYTLTALYNGSGGGPGSEQSSGGQSSGQSSEQKAQGKGKTAYEALEDMKLKNKKAITLTQTSTFLIGDGAAMQGLDKSIDFLSRDETIKMEALVYVIKKMKASDFIDAGIKNHQTIHTDLLAIEQKQAEILTRNDNTMVNILNDMRQSYSCVLIPYLISDKSGYLMDGYAVFDKLRLKDYLDHETSDGVNFIRNIMRTYPIYLKDQVSLSVSFTKTKLKANIADNQINVSIKVSFDSMIKEVITKNNIFALDEINKLTDAQNNYILDILKKPTDYSRTNGLDILGLARLVENQNYSEWKNVEAQWSQKISEINYTYKIESRISKSFLLGEDQ